MVKAGPDKLLTTVLVTTGAALIAVPLLPLLPAPAPASWGWLAASACCQLAYYFLLMQAYRLSDMSQAYPLMRGTAPLIVACVSVPLLGEALSLPQYGAIGLIAVGVLAMTVGGPGVKRGSMYAIANAAIIASYTLIDGIGVRASGAPLSYTLWLFTLTAAGMLLCVLPKRALLIAYTRTHWKTGLLGGFGTMASYCLALWAMTRAPVAMVAALRETSILFATLIAAVVLKEGISKSRLLAVTLIACGAVAMRVTG